MARPSERWQSQKTNSMLALTIILSIRLTSLLETVSIPLVRQISREAVYHHKYRKDRANRGFGWRYSS